MGKVVICLLTAYSGLPIVATNWSGHLDFLVAKYLENGKSKDKKLFAKVDYDLKPISKEAVWNGVLMEGSEWAVPKGNSLRNQMRSMYKSNGMYKKWAKKLKESILESHKQEVVYDKMRKSLFERIFNSEDLQDILQMKRLTNNSRKEWKVTSHRKNYN